MTLEERVNRMERELARIRVEMDGEPMKGPLGLKRSEAPRHSTAEEIANARRYRLAMDGLENGDRAGALGKFMKAGGWIPPEQYR